MKAADLCGGMGTISRKGLYGCLLAAALLALASAPVSPSDWGFYCYVDDLSIPQYSTTWAYNEVWNDGWRTNDWHIEQRFAIESYGVIVFYDDDAYIQVDPAASYSWDYDDLHAWLNADYVSEGLGDDDEDYSQLYVYFYGYAKGTDKPVDSYARKWKWDWGSYDPVGSCRFYMTVT